jgi:hypothetical protein
MREFFSLAAVWLSARWAELHVDGDKFFHLIGQMDYQAEMSLLLKEHAESKSANLAPSWSTGAERSL